MSAAACVGQSLRLVRIGVRLSTVSEPVTELTIWASVAQLAWRNSGRKTPLASWIENSVRALWSSHASHHR